MSAHASAVLQRLHDQAPPRGLSGSRASFVFRLGDHLDLLDHVVINKGKRMVGMLALGDVSGLAPNDLLSEYVKSVSAHH